MDEEDELNWESRWFFSLLLIPFIESKGYIAENTLVTCKKIVRFIQSECRNNSSIKSGQSDHKTIPSLVIEVVGHEPDV